MKLEPSPQFAYVHLLYLKCAVLLLMYCVCLLLRTNECCLVWLTFTTNIITKAMLIHYIDEKSLTSNLRSCRICLTVYCAFISCDILLMFSVDEPDLKLELITNKISAS